MTSGDAPARPGGLASSQRWRYHPEEAPTLSAERAGVLVRNTSDIVAVLDGDGALMYATRAVERVLGYDDDSNFGRHVLELVHPDDVERVATALSSVLVLPGVSELEEFRLAHADGSWRVVEALGNNLLDDPTVEAVILNVRDVTERRRTEEALRRSEERLRRLVQSSSDLIVMLDGVGVVTYENPAVQRVLGHESGRSIGRHPFDLVHPDDVDRLRRAVLEQLAGGSAEVLECRVRRADGNWCDLEVTLSNLIDDPAAGLLAVGRDVTERKRALADLAYRATHDSMTGLVNRPLFFDRLRMSLLRSERQPTSVAVLFIDLDDLKVMNDVHGHAVGDRALGEFARRLCGAVRPSDTVARLGGDEFAVLCDDVDGAEAIAIVERVLGSLEEPVQLPDTAVALRASIGIVLADRASEDPFELVRRADHAMYEAKKDGGGYRLAGATPPLPS